MVTSHNAYPDGDEFLEETHKTSKPNYGCLLFVLMVILITAGIIILIADLFKK